MWKDAETPRKNQERGNNEIQKEDRFWGDPERRNEKKEYRGEDNVQQLRKNNRAQKSTTKKSCMFVLTETYLV